MKFLIFIFSLIIFHPFVLANSEQDPLFKGISLEHAIAQRDRRVSAKRVKNILNKQDKNGLAPLHHAAFKRDLKKIEELLKRGADPNIQDKWGFTPLQYATVFIDSMQLKGGRIDMIDTRKRNGGITDSIIINKRLKVAHMLLENGANPNIKDKKGYTPLHRAIIANNPDQVRLTTVSFLLQNGANPNIPDKEGNTSLQLAKILDHPEIAKLIENIKGKCRGAF